MRIKPFHTIPEGMECTVVSLFGHSRVVRGPAIVPSWNKVYRHEFRILTGNERVSLYHKGGDVTVHTAPEQIFIPYESKVLSHTHVSLSPRQAVVVIDEKGRFVYHKGDETGKEVWIGPTESIHEFKWSGTQKNDKSETKVPGALTIKVLRLQETQTWVTYQLRTKDSLMVDVQLMISYDYGNIELLTKNDDPLGVMFNKIMAALTDKIGKVDFEDFKSTASDIISDLCGMELKKSLTDLGLELKEIVLRGWRPCDTRVQYVLEQAATAAAQRVVDDIEQQRKIKSIDDEKSLIEKRMDLQVENKKLRDAEQKTEIDALVALYNAFGGTPTNQSALAIVLMHLASKSGAALNINPAALSLNDMLVYDAADNLVCSTADEV